MNLMKPAGPGTGVADGTGLFRKRLAAVLSLLVVWLAVTKLFWVGYVGSDDLFYARYAFFFSRAPINWWECRLPAILAMRAGFHLFGPSETAAALPTLLASLICLAVIAWYVDWPRSLNWQTNATVLIAATLPLDVTYRTVPGAVFMASGLLVAGVGLVLKGSTLLRILGCVCIAGSIATHETMMFPAAILLGTAALFDLRRFWRPILFASLLTVFFAGLQCLYYGVAFHDPFLRLRVASEATRVYSGLSDPDTHLAGLAFLLWPVRMALFSKVFGLDLIALLILGIAAWRRLNQDHRVLLLSGLLIWLYLGFGSTVPWRYQPFARMYHFYGPLILPVAVLLPVCLGLVFPKRVWQRAAVAGIITVHLVCCAGGGRWGQGTQVSGSLLAYAHDHASQTFITDVSTLNDMYVLNGFTVPANVVALNGPALQSDFLVNKEPPDVPRIRFPERPVDAVMLNRELIDSGSLDQDFLRYSAGLAGARKRIVPVQYKLLFVPFEGMVEGRSFAIRSEGAELLIPH